MWHFIPPQYFAGDSLKTVKICEVVSTVCNLLEPPDLMNLWISKHLPDTKPRSVTRRKEIFESRLKEANATNSIMSSIMKNMEAVKEAYEFHN
jgi:hypothetical protein